MDEFHGVLLRDLSFMKGLSIRLQGSTLVFLDKNGIKWEIRTITEKRISLYHRSKHEEMMHFQRIWNTPTKEGVMKIIEYILRHEAYEKWKTNNKKNKRTEQEKKTA